MRIVQKIKWTFSNGISKYLPTYFLPCSLPLLCGSDLYRDSFFYSLPYARTAHQPVEALCSVGRGPPSDAREPHHGWPDGWLSVDPAHQRDGARNVVLF